MAYYDTVEFVPGIYGEQYTFRIVHTTDDVDREPGYDQDKPFMFSHYPRELGVEAATERLRNNMVKVLSEQIEHLEKTIAGLLAAKLET